MANRINIEAEYKFKIDIGCKNLKEKGCIGIDILDYGQGIVWDITLGIPLFDNSVEYVYMSHLLEHLEDKAIAPLFTEIFRVSLADAIIDIKTPHSETVEAYYLGHVSFWNENRIKGIVQGFNGNLKILELDKKGIELIAKLNVCKL